MFMQDEDSRYKSLLEKLPKQLTSKACEDVHLSVYKGGICRSQLEAKPLRKLLGQPVDPDNPSSNCSSAS